MAETTHYTAHLSESSTAALKDAIGQEVEYIYSSYLHVLDTFITAETLTLGLNKHKQYLVLSNQWLETRANFNYWKLNAALEDAPVGVETYIDSEGKHRPYPLRTSIIQIYPVSPISRVDIYETEDKHDDGQEIIRFDSAIQFHLEDGRSFVITAEPLISGGSIEFTIDAKLIEELLEDCTLRWSIR